MTELEMTGLLVKLANEGVTGLLVTYSGGGDSGAIDDIVYTTEKLDAYDDDYALDEIDSMDTYTPEVKYLRSLDQSLNDDLNSFLVDCILDNIEDWWNNEGGYGKVSILVPSETPE